MPDYVAGSPLQPNATVVYGEAEGTPLEMDVYLPARAVGMRPGVVFLHGGGWSGGGRHQFRWHAAQLAGLGYFAASVSYRLAGVAHYPAALDDCQLAVRFLRSHAHEYSLDPQRLAAFGSSAGGHLAALLGVRDTRPRTPAPGRPAPGISASPSDPREDAVPFPEVSSRVGWVVNVHGAHDLPALAEHGLHRSIEAFVGGPYRERREAWEDASPQRFVDGNAAAMLLLHDPRDPTVPYDQSVRLAQALMEHHRPVTFVPTPDAGHGYIYNPSNSWTRRVWPGIVRWLEEALAPS